MIAALPTAASSHSPARLLAEQAFSRAAGAPLLGGNAIELLIDGRANFDAWLAAIRAARTSVLMGNYIFNDDAIGREFRDALAERAAAGVKVRVAHDWLGCLGLSGRRYWQPLIDAGGEVRAWNPFRVTNPLGWVSRDHRKLVVVDGHAGFLSGVCVHGKWLGDPAHDVPPWRDTGMAIRGPAVADLVHGFAEVWALLGTPLQPEIAAPPRPAPAGEVELRVVATLPHTAGLYRLDQLIAAMARKTLWLTDAYFVGTTAYVQALAAAARDGVDVRLLVPGTSNLAAVGALSRAGYRPLLEAGVRVFEWNGSMLHAKTAVADGRWARVGSSNLNIASWMGNCEMDVAVENIDFAHAMQRQYECDLANATEIVLTSHRRVQRGDGTAGGRRRAGGGSSARAAAGAIRLANTFGAALTDRRVLGPAEAGVLGGGALILALLAGIALLWPRALAWPLAAIALWIAASLLGRYVGLKRKG